MTFDVASHREASLPNVPTCTARFVGVIAGVIQTWTLIFAIASAYVVSAAADPQPSPSNRCGPFFNTYCASPTLPCCSASSDGSYCSDYGICSCVASVSGSCAATDSNLQAYNYPQAMLLPPAPAPAPQPDLPHFMLALSAAPASAPAPEQPPGFTSARTATWVYVCPRRSDAF